MYYILYNLKTLKVEHIYNKPLTAKVCDNFYEINGIAEYKGEIPQNNWLTVDNIREEIETWKEKEIVESYDDNGNLVPKEVEVEYSKTHILCDLVAHFYPKRELTEEQKLEKQKKELRKKRESDCFVYINRGEVWYKRLTEAQKIEIDVWYQDWLDVTETLQIPSKPNWLK